MIKAVKHLSVRRVARLSSCFYGRYWDRMHQNQNDCKCDPSLHSLLLWESFICHVIELPQVVTLSSFFVILAEILMSTSFTHSVGLSVCDHHSRFTVFKEDDRQMDRLVTAVFQIFAGVLRFIKMFTRNSELDLAATLFTPETPKVFWGPPDPPPLSASFLCELSL